MVYYGTSNRTGRYISLIYGNIITYRRIFVKQETTAVWEWQFGFRKLKKYLLLHYCSTWAILFQVCCQ
jgi:hypothetical protein